MNSDVNISQISQEWHTHEQKKVKDGDFKFSSVIINY